MYKVAPLKASVIGVALIGFFVSYYGIYSVSFKWGFTLMTFFVILFVAGLISMTYGPVEDE